MDKILILCHIVCISSRWLVIHLITVVGEICLSIKHLASVGETLVASHKKHYWGNLRKGGKLPRFRSKGVFNSQTLAGPGNFSIVFLCRCLHIVIWKLGTLLWTILDEFLEIFRRGGEGHFRSKKFRCRFCR